MQKTAVVRSERQKFMNTTGRNVARHKNFLVHDEHEVCRIGDVVKFEECNKISKRKHHKVLEIVWSPHAEAVQGGVEASSLPSPPSA